MSDRNTARHRAPQRAATPFDSLTDTLTGGLAAVGDQLGSVGRSGAVLAVSTGLVAGMGLPATAVSGNSPGSGLSLSRPSVLNAAAVALPASVTSGAALSAPGTATLTFEHDALTVSTTTKGRPKAMPRGPVETSRSTVRIAKRKTTTSSSSDSSTGSSGSSGSSSSGGAGGGSILAIAQGLLGIPYVRGGTTRAGFDCSGFTRYVYAQAGISLPRTSSQQYAAVRHIPRSQARKGDLVFFFGSGGVYHVAIYAGGNMIIDSPRPGKSTQERAIWSSNIGFGRP